MRDPPAAALRRSPTHRVHRGAAMVCAAGTLAAAMQCFEAEVIDLGGLDVLPAVARRRGARGE